jgi:hypothetical protein
MLNPWERSWGFGFVITGLGDPHKMAQHGLWEGQ